MSKINIGIIGLGYVDLPLAIEFSKKYKVIGFDINQKRVVNLLNGFDQTDEANLEDLEFVINNKTNKNGLDISSNIKDLKNCNVYIVTVHTPIDKSDVTIRL